MTIFTHVWVSQHETQVFRWLTVVNGIPRVLGRHMICHISFIACRILGIDLHVLLGMCVLLCEYGIACALRWRVTLVGVYSTGICSPRRGTPF